MRLKSQLPAEGTMMIKRADVVSKRVEGLSMLGKQSTTTPTIKKIRPARRRQNEMRRRTFAKNPRPSSVKESRIVWRLKRSVKPKTGQAGWSMSVELSMRPRLVEVP